MRGDSATPVQYQLCHCFNQTGTMQHRRKTGAILFPNSVHAISTSVRRFDPRIWSMIEGRGTAVRGLPDVLGNVFYAIHLFQRKASQDPQNVLRWIPSGDCLENIIGEPYSCFQSSWHIDKRCVQLLHMMLKLSWTGRDLHNTEHFSCKPPSTRCRSASLQGLSILLREHFVGLL